MARSRPHSRGFRLRPEAFGGRVRRTCWSLRDSKSDTLLARRGIRLLV